MKNKLVLTIVILIISVSSVCASSFDEYFPVQTSMILNLDIAESKAYFKLAKDSMLDKTYNEVMLSLSKKLSVEFVNELKEISICFIKVRMGFLNIANSVPFVFINGNFKNKESWNSLILSLAKETTGKEPTTSSISINGEVKTVLTAGNIQYIFLNDSVLFIGLNGSSSLLEKKQISFKKAPQIINKLSKLSVSYFYIEKESVWKMPIIGVLFGDSENFESAAVYLKDNNISFMSYVKDIRLIDEKTNILKNNIISFQKRYSEIFEKEKNWLKKAPLSEFPKITKIMYADALFKKIIDNMKVSNDMNYIIASLPLDNYLKEHTLLYFFNTLFSDLYLKLNNGVLEVCNANRNQLSKAIYAYKKNDNSSLHYHFSFREKDDNDKYYTNRRLKERITKPNKSGKVSMILDIKTLMDQDCLDADPLKPDPDCEYVLFRNKRFDDLMVFCLKHSFIKNSKTSFGGVFRENYRPGGFDINITRKNVIDARDCYYNQREITKSVEAYNKNHVSKMSKLKISVLIESGCLKENPSSSLKRCDYYSEGDLTTDDGCVSCRIHGPESYKISLEDKIEQLWKLRSINFSKVDCDTIEEKDIKDIEDCSFNIRIVTGGILRYNQKNESKKITTNLSDTVISDLINEELIWDRFLKHSPECDYYIEGDMTNNGHVACKKHGYLK